MCPPEAALVEILRGAVGCEENPGASVQSGRKQLIQNKGVGHISHCTHKVEAWFGELMCEDLVKYNGKLLSLAPRQQRPQQLIKSIDSAGDCMVHGVAASVYMPVWVLKRWCSSSSVPNWR